MERNEDFIQLIHLPSEKEPFVVIKKSAGLPSAPLSEEDTNNAFYFAAKAFPKLLEVKGIKACEHGLLHRLDTRTEGLLLIALTQDFYDYMLKEQQEGRFLKKYRAECSICKENAELLGGYPLFKRIDKIHNAGFFNVGTRRKGEVCYTHAKNTKSEYPEDIIVASYFRNFGENQKTVRPVTEESGKAALKKLGKKTEYSTRVHFLETNPQKKTALIECQISKGYRHQVRCHLSWLGLPVKGDELYNFNARERFEKSGGLEKLEFYATGLEFTNPVTGETLKFKV